jgi:tRNA U34 2-thiouridine synthase MnmA/TrmU
MDTGKSIRALGLLSGGLDSILAVKVIQAQGIAVTGITFISPFFSDHAARKAVEFLKIPLIVEDITTAHLELVKHPRYGHGKAFNPCIDCHLFMVQQAGKVMEREGFSFLFTGEVLGERPMSQNKGSLDLIARKSGYGPYLVRPLSAKLLPPTEAEQQGRVDREKLLDIAGRGRKRQFALAQEFGITEYPTPAGGCLLTDQGFARRLEDLFQHQPDPSINDIQRLKVGRHFRLSDTVKLVVGRHHRENEMLIKYRQPEEYLLYCEERPGPYCILTGVEAAAHLDEALRICLAYGDGNDGEQLPVVVERGTEKKAVNVIVDKQMKCVEKRI